MDGVFQEVFPDFPSRQLLDGLSGLGLIAPAYGIALLVGSRGLLAGARRRRRSGQDTVGRGGLVLKEYLERLYELGLMLRLGGAMTPARCSRRMPGGWGLSCCPSRVRLAPCQALPAAGRARANSSRSRRR